MKVKYNDLTAVRVYGGDSCTLCCFFGFDVLCVRDKFTDLGPCISETKYYKYCLKSDIFEL